MAATFMIVVSRHVAIPGGEFGITTVRTQDAGRQHVNKTSTAVHLRFDVWASSLPEYYKEHLLVISRHLIGNDGVIVVKTQEYRSRGLNRETALARLMAVIKGLTTGQKARRSTRPTRTSKEYRLTLETQKSNVKAMRGEAHSGQG